MHLWSRFDSPLQDRLLLTLNIVMQHSKVQFPKLNLILTGLSAKSLTLKLSNSIYSVISLPLQQTLPKGPFWFILDTQSILVKWLQVILGALTHTLIPQVLRAGTKSLMELVTSSLSNIKLHSCMSSTSQQDHSIKELAQSVSNAWSMVSSSQLPSRLNSISTGWPLSSQDSSTIVVSRPSIAASSNQRQQFMSSSPAVLEEITLGSP